MKSRTVRVLESGRRAGGKALNCIEDKHIQFDSSGLESYFFRSEWNPVLYDLLLLTGAVEFCDRAVPRSTIEWPREFVVSVPVHEPERWNDPLTAESLRNALQFLTGDLWDITFIKRASPKEDPRGQGLLEFPGQYDGVLPFSNGLDSLAVSYILERSEKLTLARVRLGTIPGTHTDRRKPGDPFAALPYRVDPRERRQEPTCRHRGFKFAVLCAIAAQFANTDQVFTTESGQGALGPALVTVGQGYPDYRSHPRFLRLMEVFLNRLLGKSPKFREPRLWYTKGETLAEYLSLGVGDSDSLQGTRSCWRQARHIGFEKKRPQCGLCAACMLRRMSMHSAGVSDPPGSFLWENLSLADFDDACHPGFQGQRRGWRSFREYAIAGALHLDHLADLADCPSGAGMRREIYHLSQATGMPDRDVAMNLQSLLSRHRAEWENYLATLGNASFVFQMIGR